MTAVRPRAAQDERVAGTAGAHATPGRKEMHWADAGRAKQGRTMWCARIGQQVGAVSAGGSDGNGNHERRPGSCCRAREDDRRHDAADQPVRDSAVGGHHGESRHRQPKHAPDQGTALESGAAVDPRARLVDIGHAGPQQRGADGTDPDERPAVRGRADRQRRSGTDGLVRQVPHAIDSARAGGRDDLQRRLA